MKHYYSISDYYMKKYGTKVYKLALDGGMTCPNRDGTIDTRGCIFCSNAGSGDFAEKQCATVQEQIELAKKRVSNKVPEQAKYIPYFQNYTNTYAPITYLKALFEAAIAPRDVVGISIATRPDCLGEEVLTLLKELKAKTDVYVELGLQTVHEDTAKWIRRGYPLATFDKAVNQLKEIGCHVVVHVIFGFPGENREDILNTVKYVGNSGADGIKIQLLQILSGTDLEAEYHKGNCPPLDEDTYLTLVMDAIEYLPEDMVIHRITGDPPKKDLVAPMWCANKREVLNRFQRMAKNRDLVQGSKYKK